MVRTRKTWEPEVRENINIIIEKINNGFSINEICKEYGYSPRMTSRVLKEYGHTPVDRNTASSSLRKRNGDKFTLFESVNSEPSAYYLGLITTDGCVYSPKVKSQKQIKISLDNRDEYILSKFKEITGATQNITKTKSFSSISICSNKMANDLMSFNVHERKTFDLKFPALNQDIMWHYARGLIDGDGCVYVNDRRGSVSFCCASHDFIVAFKNWLEHNGVCVNKISKNYNWYNFAIGNASSLNTLYHNMYDNAELFLTRKKDKFDKIMKLTSKRKVAI